MKKLLSIILMVLLFVSVMLVGAFTLTASAATSGTTGYCTWTLDGTTLTISGSGNMQNYSYSSKAPWGENITNVVIENGVTSIGERAFYNCDSLTSVTIGNSVTSIGKYAFEYCDSLTSITIPDSVTSIGDYAFYGCLNLTSATIGKSVTSIGDYAFQSCVSLKSITIPDSVTSIGGSAFFSCDSLTSITIPDSVTSIGGWAFAGCDSLTSIIVHENNPNYSSQDGVLFNKDKTELIQYPAGDTRTSYTIPDGVTSIGDSAFYCCYSLASITISDSVTSIGNYAFGYCDSLWSITIPDSVTSIGNYAFYNCDSLTSIVIPDSVRSIGESAFYNCSRLISITIPDSVRSIGKETFYNCSSLTSVKIGNSVTSIGYEAFYSCGSLTSVKIGNSVTSIGEEAFRACSSLTSITIPDSVTSIGEGAFMGCSKLESITLPFVGSSRTASRTYDAVFGYIFGCTSYSESGTTSQYYSSPSYCYCYYYIPSSLKSVTITDATQIPYGAFYNCKNLTSITIPDSVRSIGESAFYNCSRLTTVNFNATNCTTMGSSSYPVFKGCTKLATVNIGENVTNIPAYAFKEFAGLTSITIPDSVTSIGDYAFSGCTGLESVYITDVAAWCGINFDGCYDNPFCYAKKLYLNNQLVTDLVIPDGITNIGTYAFYYCSSLTSITIPNSVTSIGDGAFRSCESLTSITIPNGVTSIGEEAFYCCYSLTSITIPNSVTSIGAYAFYYCSSLTSITIPNSVTSIGEHAFSDCDSLKSIVIPDSVTSIGKYAFGYCDSLTSVTIGKGVRSIGESAFYNCYSLTSITIPDSVRSIGESAFYRCESLTSITIPDSVTSIGKGAFRGCSKLESITLPFVGSSRTASGTYNAVFGYIFDYTTSSIGETYQHYDGSQSYYYYIPSSLKSVTITDATQIPYGAFYNCKNLTSITIPNSVTSISYDAFNNCSSLTSITIPDSVTSIGGSAFYNCYSLTTVNFNATNCTTMGSSSYPVFDRCTKLATVNIGENVTNIPAYVFYNCSRLTSITIPNSVTSIGNYAFSNCTGLTSATIGKSVTSIGWSAFKNCTSLKKITLPFIGKEYNGVENTHFGTIFGASKYNENKSYVPNSLETVIVTGGNVIKGYAFYQCTSLKNVYVTGGVRTIESSAFYNCTNIEKIYLSSDVINVSSSSFNGCNMATVYWCKNSVFYNIPTVKVCGYKNETIYLDHSYDNACDKTCNICSNTRIVPDHTSNNGTVTKKATCTATGTKTYKCTVCGTTTKTETIKATGHKYSNACDKTCNSCGATRSVGAHTYKSYAATKASLTANGILRYKCTECGYVASTKTTLYKASSFKLSTTIYSYDGKTKTPSVTVKDSAGKVLKKDTDYDVTYASGRKNVGTYNVTIKMKGKYSGTRVLTFKICKHKYSNDCDKTCNSCGATRSVGAHTYKSYAATKASLTANGILRYKCTECGYVASTKTTIYKSSSFKLSATSYTYDGKVKSPTVTVKDSAGKVLKKGTDYDVTYASGRKNVGTYKVTIKMKGKYSGTRVLTFKINPIKSTTCKFTLSATSYTYDGKVKTPTITVKNAKGTKLTKGIHYDVTYSSGRKNVGTYKVTIKMKGNYSGTKTLTFKINPAMTTVSKVTPAAKKLTVSITKKTAQTTGYEIQYSTSSKFTTSTTKTKVITKNTTTSASITSLKAKTTYYVRVRTYKTVNGTKYYSAWSVAKSAKTK